MLITDLPNVLQYGLTGLAAVIVLLAYRLLTNQSKKERPNQSLLKTIKLFMGLGIVLSLISGAGNIAELYTDKDQLEGQHALQTKLAQAKVEIERLKTTSQGQETVKDLKTQIVSLQSQLAAAQESVKVFEGNIATESRVLNRFVAESIEFHLRYTRGKTKLVETSKREALRCILFKRAVFIELLNFEANSTILNNALMHLVNRGISNKSPCIENVVNDLDSIKTLKLRWLEDEAIPALQYDINNLGAIQRSPKADVKLPDVLAIPKDIGDFNLPEIGVSDMLKLQEEVTFLKNNL